MFTFPATFDRLIEAAATSLLLCALGSAAVLLCRQPVRRMRIIVLTLGACILAPVVSFVPWLPHWSLPRQLPEDRQTKIADTGSKIEETNAVGVVRLESPGLDLPAFPSAADPIPDREPTLVANPAAATPDRSANFDSPSSSSRSSVTASRFLSNFPPDPHPSIVVAYLAGLVGLTAWWLVGLAALCRVLRVSRPAPVWCRELLSDVAGPAGARVQLVVSPRAVQPFTFAWRRPVIVLPIAMVEGHDNRGVNVAKHRIQDSSQPSTAIALRCCLAHEWSHVAQGDVWTWSLAGVVRLVYYYQPLCWWLRRQLRLSQDYLADAAAARQSSPIEYAEFLATRALGRPLAMGLGITAGKSDLYRRVAMLLKDNRPLESRCPAGWTAFVGAFAIALVLMAATFGDRTTTQASAGVESVSVPASDAQGPAPATEVDNVADSQSIAADYPDGLPDELVKKMDRELSRPEEQLRDDTSQLKPPAEESANVAPQDSEKQKLIDGLLTRAEAIQSGQFAYTVQINFLTGQESGKERSMRFVLSGERWAEFEEETPDAAVLKALNDGSHYFQFAGGSASGNKPPKRRLIVNHPRRVAQANLWSSSLIAFQAVSLRKHVAQARFLGTETTNGVETQIFEWPASAPENKLGTSPRSEPAQGPGMLRVYIAPQLGYAVVKIKHLDKFGLAESVTDFSEFKEVAPALFFPFREQYQDRTLTRRIHMLRVSDINRPVSEQLFVLRIPTGTQIEDVRAHRNDKVNGNGPPMFDSKEYPLRNFMTWAEDLDGLPPAVLAEMDRDLLSPEEWERIKASVKDKSSGSEPPVNSGKTFRPNSQAAKADVSTPAAAQSSTGQSDSRLVKSTAAAPTEKKTGGKEMFRYAGKSFNEWRDVLLTDLDPGTRIKAFEALQAFGPTLHAQEVAAAVQEVLKTDQPDLNEFKVQSAAFELLSRLGEPAVSVLESQLASETQQTRRTALEALARVAATTDAATPVLLRAAKDGDASVRATALSALIMQHPQSAGVLDAWSFALVNDENWSVQEAILGGLIETRSPIGVLPAAVLFKPLESNVGNIRTLAAVALAMRGAGSDLVAEKMKRALLDSAPEFRSQFVDMLLTRSHAANRGPHAAATVPVLLALLETESTYTPQGGNTDLNAIQVISQMPMEGPARAALPVLVQAAEGKLPGKSMEFRLAAVTALGKVGAAAKEALPALHQLLAGPPPIRPPASPQDAFRPSAEPNLDSIAKWRSTIQSAIRKIEGN